MTRRRILAGLAISAVVLSVSCVRSTDHHAPRPQVCADRLGVEWDREQGATERLAAFSRCVEGKR